MRAGEPKNEEVQRQGRWDETVARAALHAHASSGESTVSFAWRIGVSSQRMIYWRKRLSAPPVFAPVRLVGTERAARTPSERQIEIALSDVTVRVREDFDVGRLCQIARALSESRRC